MWDWVKWLSRPLVAIWRRLSEGNRWISTHAKLLPFGSGIVTYIVAKFVEDGKWLFWRDWEAMANGASLGVVGYAFTAATLEVIIVVGVLAYEHFKHEHARIRQEERAGTLDAIEERLRKNPGANPLEVVEALRQETVNGNRKK